MKLSELAFACYVYSRMSGYDSSYKRLLNITHPEIDLRLNQHLLALLQWLNDWGCRQFAKEYHETAANEIKEWYNEFNQHFILKDATILFLTDESIELVERAYAGLVDRTASHRKVLGERELRIEVGPTGTAKILFALRPNALVPWDEPIRKKMSLDGTAHSYGDYLRIVKDCLQALGHECQQNGFDLMDLPAKVGRPDSSIAKLVDEFFWVTISRDCPAPSRDDLKRWVAWS